MTPIAEVDVRQEGTTAVIAVRGEIDLSNAAELRERAFGAVSNAALSVILDASGLTYVDSSGVGLLLELAARCGWRRQRFVVVAPPGSRVGRVLELAGTSTVLAVADSVDAAIAADGAARDR